MKILYIEMENILSIGSLRLDFEDSGLILMDGWNYDDDSANGAGKTACFLGIPYAIWDKFPRKITKSEILRKGSKKGYSKVAIQVNQDIYEVKRSRPKNVEFFKNGQEIEMSQEEFESILGLSYTQYLICMYSAQTEGKKLISLNDTEKKDFILQLMDLEKFQVKKKEVDATIKNLNVDKNNCNIALAKIDSAIDVYRGQQVDVSDIKSKISNLDTSGLQASLNKYLQVQKPDISKYVELRQKISDRLDALDAKYREYLAVKAKLDFKKAELMDVVNNKITCPHCKTDIVKGVSLEDIKNSIKQDIANLTNLCNSYPNFSTQRQELNSIRDRANEAQRRDELEYNNAVSQISDIKSKIVVINNQASVLQQKLDQQDDISNQIAELKTKRDKVSIKLKKIESDIEVLETVSMTLSPTGAPAYIMDTVVDVFNEKIFDYVAEIWPNASYMIQTFNENKSGDIKAKFSDKLVIGGKERSIGSLSGGEYKCLSLAVDFAIMDVIESMFSIHMSPIVLDEPFEGLDASNRERAISLLEKKSQKHQIWVIDHMSESKTCFSKIVRIEKKNGISKLSE